METTETAATTSYAAPAVAAVDTAGTIPEASSSSSETDKLSYYDLEKLKSAISFPESKGNTSLLYPSFPPILWLYPCL